MAYSMGVSWEEFWTLNPKIIKLMCIGHKRKLEELDSMLHTMGAYNKIAYDVVMAHFGAGLNGKRSDARYIEQPFSQQGNPGEPLTEEEKQREVDLFFARENTRRLNWKLNKNSEMK